MHSHTPCSLARRALLQTAIAVGMLSALPISYAQSSAPALRIGLAAPNTAIDPHAQNNSPNNAVLSHVFDTLVVYDEKQDAKPGLAESWKVVDDTHWEFTLRKGVVFSDGTPLTAKDVVASFARIEVLPSVSSFKTYTRSIDKVEAVDDHVLRFTTKAPTPLLPSFLTRVRIIKETFKDAATADFNSGKAAIGTGPYVIEEYVPGTRIKLKRNEKYWGSKQGWETVELRIVTDKAARLASMLSGDLDLIEAVPATDLARLKSDKRFKVVSAPSNRLIYIALDQARDVSPFVRDNSGAPMIKNPLKDLRVRQAISMAINREAIVDRVMDKQAIVASQFLTQGRFGTSDKIKPQPYDVKKATELLKEAGYPQGFQLTLHSSSDRYINDSRIIQTVAQLLSRIGITARAEVQPWATYVGAVTGRSYSAALGGWGANTGETSNPLGAVVATRDDKAGMGTSNYGGYSNPELDALLKKAVATLDDDSRAHLLAQASEIAINDLAIIPLHHEVSVWAMSSKVDYVGRADQYTMAMGASPSAK